MEALAAAHHPAAALKVARRRDTAGRPAAAHHPAAALKVA